MAVIEGLRGMTGAAWLEMTSRSDPGRVRANNEDAVYAEASLGLAVLADGMGGYNAGEVASGMAIQRLATSLGAFMRAGAPDVAGDEAPVWVRQALNREIAGANIEILGHARRDARCSGMGTTLVACCFYRGLLTVAHLGDSRLYRLRAGQLNRLTKDHSLLQVQIDAGLLSEEEARVAEHRNLVTRALGVEAEIEIEVGEFAVEVGDLYLLCSDGLTDMLADADIAKILREQSRGIELVADRLVRYSNEAGGRDNISVVLVRVLETAANPLPSRV